MTDAPQQPTPPDDAGAPVSRPAPAAPGAAAARRARQLGGARRPLPRPAGETPAGTAAEGTAAAAARPGAPSPAAGPAPRSSVGKAAARPRPRPRPRPDTGADHDPAPDDPAPDLPAPDLPDTPPAAVPPHGVGRAFVGVCLVLTAALLAVGVVFLVRAVTAEPQISQRETDRAVSAAKSDVALVTSYGYQTIDADAAKAAAVLTGQFRTDYLKSIDTVVKPQLPATQTVSTGQVDTAGLESADTRGRQVVVLVYGQQSVTDKAQTTPRIDAFQVRVTMQLVGGQWLVAKLDRLGNDV